MINRKTKENQVSNLAESFLKSRGTFLVNCIGMNVREMTELRKSLNDKKSEIKIIRNTLARLSLEKHSDMKSAFDEHLSGPNAFVMVFGEDVSDVAKIIDNISEENESFQIKCAVLDGLTLAPEAVKSFARLPSRDVLRAQFLAVLNAPASKFLGTLQAPSASLLRVLDSYKQTKN